MVKIYFNQSKQKDFLVGNDEPNNIGYEFHGCLFHGCPKCLSPSTFNSLKRESWSIFNQHKDRIRYLKQHLSSLVEIWECPWDTLVKTDE
jgi:hypothetical protein